MALADFQNTGAELPQNLQPPAVEMRDVVFIVAGRGFLVNDRSVEAEEAEQFLVEIQERNHTLGWVVLEVDDVWVTRREFLPHLEVVLPERRVAENVSENDGLGSP